MANSRPPLRLLESEEAAWLVRADELMARGDPRGELIRLQIDLEHAPPEKRKRFADRERKFFIRHRDELLGRGGALGTLDATWRRGYIAAARSPTSQAMAVLLRHESGVFLDSLVLDNPHLALDEQVEVVGASRHRTLRELTIRSDDQSTRFEGVVPVHSVLGLPALEVLAAHVRELELGSRPGESRLRHLELSARRIPIEALARWSFPRLLRLELGIFPVLTRWRGSWPANDWPVARPPLALPARLVDSAMAPKLEGLTLREYLITSEAAGELARLIERGHRSLRRVDLTECSVESGARAWLERLRFPGLVLPPE